MVLEQIKQIISNQLGTAVEDINENTNLKEDLQADSLDVVELVMATEEAFDIEIDDDVVVTFNTVGDVVKYIESKQ